MRLQQPACNGGIAQSLVKALLTKIILNPASIVRYEVYVSGLFFFKVAKFYHCLISCAIPPYCRSAGSREKSRLVTVGRHDLLDLALQREDRM